MSEEKLYTLEQVKAYLEANKEDGCKCPACDAHVEIRKWKISDKTAECLIRLCKLTMEYPNTEYFHVERDINVPLAVGGSFAKLRWFFLIEEKPKEDGEKGRTSGFWKITDYGKKFVLSKLPVKKYVHLYRGKKEGYSGKKITIIDSLGDKFDYDELMGR